MTTLPLTLFAFCAPIFAQEAPIDAAAPKPAVAEVAADEIAAQAPGIVLTFSELDELLVRRFGLGEQGRSALRSLVELEVIEQLAREGGLEITRPMLNKRWQELDAEIKRNGVPGGLPEYLEQSGVDAETFREYLRLALVHETLARRALGIPEGDPISGEQQTAWLENAIASLGYREEVHPYDDGLVATCGAVTIDRDEFGKHLREHLPVDDLRKACTESLLERKIRARMPDLSEKGLEDAVDGEVERRRLEIAANPAYKGVGYEELLKAKGLSMAILRGDPAIRAAALAHLWVDRRHDADGLRGVYDSERDFFDGLFGPGVETRLILLKAAMRKNELNPRTFEDADAELSALGEQVKSIEDFERLARIHSEARPARETGGSIGVITRGATEVPEPIRRAAFEVLDTVEGNVKGRVVGPVRVQGASVLICLGERRPAPTWETMSVHVHTELRRRFMEEALSAKSVTTWLDAE